MSQAVAIEAPKPGIYPDTDFADYRAWPCMNFHTLVAGNISMRHLKSKLDGFGDDDSQSRKFGRAVHCAILEPEQFSKRFLVSTPCVARVKAGEGNRICGNSAKYISPVPKHWDDFAAQAEHVLTQCGYTFRNKSEESASLYYENCRAHVRVSDHDPNEKTAEWMNDVRCHELRLDSPVTIIDQLSTVPNVNTNTIDTLKFWYCGVKSHAPHDATEPADYIGEAEQNRIERIKSALRDHGVVKMLRSRGGQEMSIVAELDGILCKGRADKLILDGPAPIIADLKKCQREKSEMSAFAKSVRDYNYDEQAAFYVDIVKAATGVECRFQWVVIEDSDDPIVEVYYPSDFSLDVGRAKYRSALSGYKACLKSGKWPSYTSFQPKELLMPWGYEKANEGLVEAYAQ